MHAINKLFTLFMSFLALCTISSCGGKKVIEEPVPPPTTPGVIYRIGPEDILNIHVWKEPELSLSVTVRADGKISMPLIDDVHVSGLTPLELKKDITRKLSAFIDNPSVSVIVEETNSLKIFVMGNVMQPGVYEIDREINLLQAISMAGGLTKFAQKSAITVLRKYGGVEKTITINSKKITSGKNPELNIPLQPGDLVFVP